MLVHLQITRMVLNSMQVTNILNFEHREECILQIFFLKTHFRVVEKLLRSFRKTIPLKIAQDDTLVKTFLKY